MIWWVLMLYWNEIIFQMTDTKISTCYQNRQIWNAPKKSGAIVALYCMVVGFTTTYAIHTYHHWCCWFESHSWWGVQHYVIKFVNDMRQICGFLTVLRFPPRYNWNIVESGVKHHKNNKKKTPKKSWKW